MEGVPLAGTSTCSGLAARWESELIIVPWTAMTKSAQPFELPCYQQLFAILQILGLLLAIYFVSAL